METAIDNLIHAPWHVHLAMAVCGLWFWYLWFWRPLRRRFRVRREARRIAAAEAERKADEIKRLSAPRDVVKFNLSLTDKTAVCPRCKRPRKMKARILQITGWAGAIWNKTVYECGACKQHSFARTIEDATTAAGEADSTAATECRIEIAAVPDGKPLVIVPAECGVREVESRDDYMTVEIALEPGDSIKITRAADEEPIKAPVDQPLAKLAVGDRTSHPSVWKMGIGPTAAAAAAGYKASRESKPLEVPATVMLPPAPDGWKWIVDSWFRYDNYVGPVYEGCPEANECHIAGWFKLVRK